MFINSFSSVCRVPAAHPIYITHVYEFSEILNALFLQFLPLPSRRPAIYFHNSLKNDKKANNFTLWRVSDRVKLVKNFSNSANCSIEPYSMMTTPRGFFCCWLPVLHPVLSFSVPILAILDTWELKFWNVINSFFAPNWIRNTMGLLKISSFELHLGSNLTRNTLILTII